MLDKSDINSSRQIQERRGTDKSTRIETKYVHIITYSYVHKACIIGTVSYCIILLCGGDHGYSCIYCTYSFIHSNCDNFLC